MKKNGYIILAVIFVASLLVIQRQQIAGLKAKNETLTETNHALLDTVTHYRTKDGLQAAQVAELRLTMDELKKYRAEDIRLLESLKLNHRDVERFTTIETVTRDTVYSVIRDSMIIREQEPLKVRAVNIDKRWYSIHGWIDGDTLSGSLTTRSALKIVETVKYKRFLGFLWKTNKIKDRHVDVTSLNPNETIENVEFIVVEP